MKDLTYGHYCYGTTHHMGVWLVIARPSPYISTPTDLVI